MIEEVPRKLYVAYRSSQNIVCMEVKAKHIKLWLKLSSLDIKESLEGYRDVSNIGHYGTGNVEFTVSSEPEFGKVKKYIEMAYHKIGS